MTDNNSSEQIKKYEKNTFVFLAVFLAPILSIVIVGGFGFMIWIFLICSRGSIRLTKFVRFNIIQAILLNIVCSCIGSIYAFLPIILRESTIGILLANFLYLGTVIIIVYSSFLILCGRYPKIPILTEAAKLQVQRGYLD